MTFRAWLDRFACAMAFAVLACGAAGSAEPQRIAVVGGGMIGQRVVTEALARGHSVTLIVRNPARVELDDPRLAVKAGDVLDRAAIARAVAGHDVVVSAVGTGRVPGADGSLYLAAAESLVAALRGLSDEAPRLIAVGNVGSLVAPDGKRVLERVPEDRRAEHLGQKAALDYYRGVRDVRWSYVSPPARIEPGERTGRYRTGGDALLVDETGQSRITMEDFAVAVVDEAESARHVGTRFTVAY